MKIYFFCARSRSILVLYQRTHSESSANGITGSAIKISLVFGITMCVALSKANKETVFTTRHNISESILPWTFFVISICWIFFSGSWMLWNDEARLFVYRKIFSSIHICMNRVFAKRPKDKRRMTRKMQEARRTNQRICDCETDNACPNCIAQEVIKKKAGTTKLRH